MSIRIFWLNFEKYNKLSSKKPVSCPMSLYFSCHVRKSITQILMRTKPSASWVGPNNSIPSRITLCTIRWAGSLFFLHCLNFIASTNASLSLIECLLLDRLLSYLLFSFFSEGSSLAAVLKAQSQVGDESPWG